MKHKYVDRVHRSEKMTKVLREVAPKVSPDLEKAMHRRAQALYQDAAPDLPRHGKDHWQAAHGYVADTLSDEFNKLAPGLRGTGTYGRITKKALKDWVPDDRAESRANSAKQTRADARRQRERLKPKKEPAPPKIKTRRGIGSY